MRLVAITQRITENKHYPETRDCLDIRWAQLAERLGLIPIVLPTHYNPEIYFDTFNLSGIILTGGNDLSCINDSHLSRLRDEYERKLLKIAVTKSVPVIGICRGMQFIANFFGSGIHPVANHCSGTRHLITTSQYSRYLPSNISKEVNSFHNFAVSSIPAGFREAARSHDGIPEAMEHEELPIFCQMWHPEREMNPDEHDVQAILKLFSSGRI